MGFMVSVARTRSPLLFRDANLCVECNDVQCGWLCAHVRPPSLLCVHCVVCVLCCLFVLLGIGRHQPWPRLRARHGRRQGACSPFGVRNGPGHRHAHGTGRCVRHCFFPLGGAVHWYGIPVQALPALPLSLQLRLMMRLPWRVCAAAALPRAVPRYDRLRTTNVLSSRAHRRQTQKRTTQVQLRRRHEGRGDDGDAVGRHLRRPADHHVLDGPVRRGHRDRFRQDQREAGQVRAPRRTQHHLRARPHAHTHMRTVMCTCLLRMQMRLTLFRYKGATLAERASAAIAAGEDLSAPGSYDAPKLW